MGKKGGGRVRIKQVGGSKTPMNPLADLMENNEPPIIVPPKMDSNITHFFPITESFTLNSKYKLFPCIWPTYMDKDKSGKEGRRISVEDAVPNPSVLDISEVLQSMGVRHVIQPYKGYSRDVESRWDNPGRVLYDLEQLKDTYDGGAKIVELNDDDDDDVPNLAEDGNGDGGMTQKQCWRLIAKQIESMPGRKIRLEEAKRKEEEQKRKAREDARMRAVLNSKKQSTTGGSSKKKSAKKRK